MQQHDIQALDERSGREVVEALQRWESFGAVWRVVRRDSSQVTIGLFRCDAGEEVARVVSRDPDVLEFLDSRHTGD